MTANSTINILYVGLHVVVKQVVVVFFLSVNIVPLRKATGSSKIFGCVIIVIIKFVDQDILNFYLVFCTYVNPWNSSTLYIYILLHNYQWLIPLDSKGINTITLKFRDMVFVLILYVLNQYC